MRYSDLKEYAGLETCCVNCKRSFKHGEVVIADRASQRIFCYGDDGGCHIAWTFITGKTCFGDPVRYSSITPTSNGKRSLFRRFLGLFGGSQCTNPPTATAESNSARE